VALPADLNYK